MHKQRVRTPQDRELVLVTLATREMAFHALLKPNAMVLDKPSIPYRVIVHLVAGMEILAVRQRIRGVAADSRLAILVKPLPAKLLVLHVLTMSASLPIPVVGRYVKANGALVAMDHC